MSDSREPLSAKSPSSKITLNKVKGRQNSTGSIAIRFNPSSLNDEEDDELDLFCSPSSNISKDTLKFEIRQDSPEEEVAPTSEVVTSPPSGQCRSSSAPVSEVTTPTIVENAASGGALANNNHSVPGSLGGNIDEVFEPNTLNTPSKDDGAQEKSFISGIKERLQDPLTSFMDKIEELKAESQIVETIERKLRKTDSLDINTSSRPVLSSSLRGANTTLADAKINRTRHGSLDLEENIRGCDPVSGQPLDIVNDFYAVPEPGEGFDGHVNVSSVPRSSSSDAFDRTTHAKSRHLFKFKTKASDGAGADSTRGVMPISLSKLLSENGSKEEDDSSEFYDPKDESPPTTAREAKEDKVDGEEAQATEEPAPAGLSLVHRQRAIAGAVILLAYLLVPLPVYVSGLISGGVLGAVVMWMYHWWTAPPTPLEPYTIPDLNTLPPLAVPNMKDSKNIEGKFKGWMNEISNYSLDEYHINHTHSTYVTLEGSKLRLQTPRQNMPRRAMWDEPYFCPTFVHQRFFELKGSLVKLEPSGLIKKRLWSKKYPICILIKEPPTDSGITGDNVKNLDEEGSVEDAKDQQVSKPVGDVVEGKETRLYLFGRTSREKEEWFRRFVAAALGMPWPTSTADLVLKLHPGAPDMPQKRTSSSSSVETVRHKREGSTDSTGSDMEKEPLPDFTSPGNLSPEENLAVYLKYMAKVMPSSSSSSKPPNTPTTGKKEEADWSSTGIMPIICEPQVLWVNSLISRCFWDFLREQYWCKKMQDKLQKKLSKIHVPYFINELTVTGIELGREVPVIRRASQPYIDDRGLWVDLDITYNGGFFMILETKCNLMKLKKTTPEEGKELHATKERKIRSPVTDSDEEDSAESSTDDEAAEEPSQESSTDESNRTGAGGQSSVVGGATSRKLLRIVDRITQSKYFQQATENKYIKRAMEGVSNTRLELRVELKSMIGALAINIPPPPTDRIWYGFRANPKLWLSAVPKVGEREFNVSHITDWIEKKLTIEFQRVFVLPNMDDVPIPLMCDHLPDSTL